jgi:Protein of unknown function (DUF1579)
MHIKPQAEHQWLNQFLGEWSSETEYRMGADQSLSKSKGSEVVRSLGGIWIVAEGAGEMPDGEMGKTVVTLGYDPKSDRYVGTFVGGMMTHLWIYNGSLDAAGKVLTLDTEGPNFAENAMTKYQDIIEFVSPDHRMMTSKILEENGNWLEFMTAHYLRQR